MTNKYAKNLGDVGEVICYGFLVEQNQEPVMSDNEYDSEKDIKIRDNKKVECKTQPAYWSKNWATIRENQLRKCLNCDILMFVMTPLIDKPEYKWQNCILLSEEPSKLKYVYYKKNDRDMVGFPIEQEGLKLVKWITNPKHIKALRDFRGFEIA